MLIISMDVIVKLQDSKTYNCTMCNTLPCCLYGFILNIGDIRRIWEKKEELSIQDLSNFVALDTEGNYILKKKDKTLGSDCMFYEKGCELHRRFGKRYKPVRCQVYPQKTKLTSINENKYELLFWRSQTEACPATPIPIESKLDEVGRICKLFVKQYVEHRQLINEYSEDNDNPKDKKTLLKMINTQEKEFKIKIEFQFI